MNQGQNLTESIEKKVDSSTNILDALEEMQPYRFWSDGTISSYKLDVERYEAYLMDEGIQPTLEQGNKLHLVNQWIRIQGEHGDAYKTIMRRVATLSTIYAFYKELGVVNSNSFKASKVPGAHVGSYSRTMDMEDLKSVFVAIYRLKEIACIDVEIPVKLLLFTGLRNHSLQLLHVKDIDWKEELLIYDTGIQNSKHKLQLLPLPPIFLGRLKAYIEELTLRPEDPLCYGIKGKPLQNKQLNRITNLICEELGWSGEEKVTPHGFRYTIATLLDERDISHQSIKYLLGHSEKENLRFYLRRDKKKIYQIKKALTEIEKELEGYLDTEIKDQPRRINEVQTKETERSEEVSGGGLPYSEGFLLELSRKNPEMFEKLMMQLFKGHTSEK